MGTYDRTSVIFGIGHFRTKTVPVWYQTSRSIPDWLRTAYGISTVRWTLITWFIFRLIRENGPKVELCWKLCPFRMRRRHFKNCSCPNRTYQAPHPKPGWNDQTGKFLNSMTHVYDSLSVNSMTHFRVIPDPLRRMKILHRVSMKCHLETFSILNDSKFLSL